MSCVTIAIIVHVFNVVKPIKEFFQLVKSVCFLAVVVYGRFVFQNLFCNLRGWCIYKYLY